MSPEDMQRFEIEGRSYDDAQTVISCERCAWVAVYDEPLSLAELVQRAEEHTEVCR